MTYIASFQALPCISYNYHKNSQASGRRAGLIRQRRSQNTQIDPNFEKRHTQDVYVNRHPDRIQQGVNSRVNSTGSDT